MANDLGSRLRRERIKADLSQRALAKRLNPEVKTGIVVSKWELGKSAPGAGTMAALARLGFDIHYILTGERKQTVDSICKLD